MQEKFISWAKRPTHQSFFSISPTPGAAFASKKQISEVDRPVCITGSASDSMAPVLTNARHFRKLVRGGDYYEFKGRVGHYVMLNDAIDEVKKSDPVYFADDPSVNRSQVHGELTHLATQFFKKQLK